MLYVSGFTHNFVSVEEVAEKLKTSIEPLKIKVEDKFDEIAALVKEVTILGSHWDIDTQFGVRLIDEAEQGQVSTIVGFYPLRWTKWRSRTFLAFISCYG